MAVTLIDRVDVAPGDIVVAVTSWDPPPGWQRAPEGGPMVWTIYTGTEVLPQHCTVYRFPAGWDGPVGPPTSYRLTMRPPA